MRLRDIHTILLRTVDDLQVQITNVQGNQPQQQHSRKISSFRKAVDGTRLIRSAGVLQAECDAVLVIDEVTESARQTVVVAVQTADQLQSALAQLRQKAALLSEALESILGPDKPEIVAIKLPEDLDLAGTAKVLEDLNKLLTQALVNDYVKGEVTLDGFDRGSEWLVIALGGIAAVNVLGHMVRLHFSMEEKKLDIEAKREVVRGLKIKNESLEDLDTALKKELELHFQLEVESVFKIGKLPKKANEERQRIKHSIQLLGELLRRGLEVQPSIATPRESRILFPQIPGHLKELLALPDKKEDEKDGEP